MGFLGDLFGTSFTSGNTGGKVLPVVQIVRIDCRSRGGDMEIYAYIRNEHHERIELDKVRLLGTTHELDDFLDPSETKSHLLYSGRRPNNTYQRECELVYKGPDGDYFASIHYIDYQDEADKTYSIKSLQLQHPIRDV